MDLSLIATISQNPPRRGGGGVSVVPKGLYSRDDILYFNASSNASGSFGDAGNCEVPVTSIDSFFSDKPEPPTFIKMDIEGSEGQALLGAENTIKQYKPKLAICVYHKLEDMYELPKIIKSFNPAYKMYLRHYSDRYLETVLYAVDDSM